MPNVTSIYIEDKKIKTDITATQNLKELKEIMLFSSEKPYI